MGLDWQAKTQWAEEQARRKQAEALLRQAEAKSAEKDVRVAEMELELTGQQMSRLLTTHSHFLLKLASRCVQCCACTLAGPRRNKRPGIT